MQKIIIALIAIAVLVSGYRFIASRRKPPEEKLVEIIKTTPSPTQTAKEPAVIPQDLGEQNQGLPESGVSSKTNYITPTKKEIEEIIKEFRLKR